MIFFLWQGRAENKWESLFTHILLIHNYFPSHGGINPSFWSIAAEVQLYVVYILLFLAIKRYGWRLVLATCFSVEFCIRLLIGFDMIPTFLWRSPLTYLFSWLIGAGAAELYKTGGAAKVRVTGLLVTVSIASAVACCFVKPLAVFSFTLFAIATALSIIYMHQRAVAIHVPYLAIFGVISYSVYLIHQPVLEEIGAFFGHRVPLFFGHRVSLFTFFVCILGVLPLYWISRLMWKHVEIPSINAGYRILSKLKDRQRPADQMEVVSFPLLANEDLSIHNGTLTPVRPKI
jgi:peptidoglycan/LPS O-acetylase OafA/YrhL